MSDPHQVSEPENPLDYYRRLQATEAALARADALLKAGRVLLVGYRDGTFPAWPEGLLDAITAHVAQLDTYLRDREGGKA